MLAASPCVCATPGTRHAAGCAYGGARPFVSAIFALAVLSAHRFGVSAARRSADENSSVPEDIWAQAIYIEEVPVYNYQHAFRAISNEPLSSSTRVDRRHDLVDWILVLVAGRSDQMIIRMCDELQGGATCLWKGTPDQGGLPAMVVRGTEVDLEGILRRHPVVEFVEPDQFIAVPPDIPEDSDAPVESSTQQTQVPWGLDRINARSGLDSFYGVRGGQGVHVYVMDTGIRRTHQDFGDRVIPTLDIHNDSMVECEADDTECAVDRHGHGTHCAGIVGGSTSGVAKQATLHAVKVFQDTSSGLIGRWSWFLESLDYVATKGERPAVISASLGGTNRGRVRAVKRFIDQAVNAGVPVVVSAGNSNDDACEWTCGFVESAITVGSTRRDDGRSGFSNKGPCLELFAPGSAIPSASHRSDTGFRLLSGTSMACPHVSGAAALLLADNTSMVPADVVATLQDRATRDVVTDSGTGSPNLLLYVPVASGQIQWATMPEKCLDVLGGNPSNGNNIALWDCMEGNPNQLFILDAANSTGMIRWAGSPGKCVDVLGGSPANGNNVALWDCIDNNPNQAFTVPSQGTSGQIQWATNPNKCLDVLGGIPNNGNNIALWDCEIGNANQLFRYSPQA